MDSVARSIAKACTWRVLASLCTGLIAYVLTQEISVATIVMGGEMVVKLVLYLIHERVWTWCKWGIKKAGE